MTLNIATATTYIGSSQSNKFHYTDCRWAKKINPGNAIYFSSREEAFSYTLNIATATTYIGSSQSNKFHYTDCRWAKKINPGNAIYFSSREEAFSYGYVPCKVCKP